MAALNRWTKVLLLCGGLLASALAAGCNDIVPASPGPVAADAFARRARMAWFREARFGMFIHYNMFSQWRDPEYRHLEKHPEENTPEEHDRKRVTKLNLDADAVTDWVRTAKAAGMKYCVLTTKHNGGFCLWNSTQTDFNSVRLGPKRDIVAEFVRACRAEGMKIGFYYALNDRHHGLRDAAFTSEKARQEIIAYTRALLRELMTQYGRIDILWYDEPWPMGYGGEWQSREINTMVRTLQPGILINDRMMTAEDFTCPERGITPTTFPDQYWEACMPFNAKWAHHPTAPETYLSTRAIIDMLYKCTAWTGNLLLNVGPNPYTGRMQDVEKQRLTEVGQWLRAHAEAVYGDVDRIEVLKRITNDAGGKWTRKGNVAYLWLPQWPAGGKVVLENVTTQPLSASILTDATPLTIESNVARDTGAPRKGARVILSGLPEQCPETLCHYAILKIEFAGYPR